MTIPPLAPPVVERLRRLARSELSVPEIWRRVRPELVRLGLPVPSYSSVRRFVLDERAWIAAARVERLEASRTCDFPVRIQLYPGRIILK